MGIGVGTRLRDFIYRCIRYRCNKDTRAGSLHNDGFSRNHRVALVLFLLAKQAGSACEAVNGATHNDNCMRKVAHDDLRIQPEYVIPSPREHLIAPRVRAAQAPVDAPISTTNRTEGA